jgi:hypothetical protein
MNNLIGSRSAHHPARLISMLVSADWREERGLLYLRWTVHKKPGCIFWTVQRKPGCIFWTVQKKPGCMRCTVQKNPGCILCDGVGLIGLGWVERLKLKDNDRLGYVWDGEEGKDGRRVILVAPGERLGLVRLVSGVEGCQREGS